MYLKSLPPKVVNPFQQALAFMCLRYKAFENTLGKGEIAPNKINPLPHMPILGSSNSAANTDMMSKIWTNWDTTI